MKERVWGETTRLVGQGNVGEAISLLSVGILICKMRINSPYFMEIEGMAAQSGRSTNENCYHYYYYSDINASLIQMPASAQSEHSEKYKLLLLWVLSWHED